MFENRHFGPSKIFYEINVTIAPRAHSARNELKTPFVSSGGTRAPLIKFE